MQGQGFVSYAGSKPFGSKVLYSFKMRDDQTWYNCGEKDPKVATGDSVEFDYEIGANGKANVAVPSLRKKAGGPEVSRSVGSASLANGASGTAASREYWDNKTKSDVARDIRIQHQSARNAAIEVVGILVAKDLLKLPEKNASEAVLGKIADITEKFFNESSSVGTETPEVVSEAA